jgi:archaellum biogenesis ATPase FlaH
MPFWKFNFRKIFSDINDNIKNWQTNNLLLDDLDRLETEILNTLKLIRTLSDFNNVIFITLAMTENILLKLLKCLKIII